MHGYAIVKVEADSLASQDCIVAQFNDYMQCAQHRGPQSFVEKCSGYFRIEYGDAVGASSAGIVAFGNFLQSSGYTLRAMHEGRTIEGEAGTEILFADTAGKEERVVLTTLKVY